MSIDRVWSVFWSATGNTGRVTIAAADMLAAALNAERMSIDFTLPKERVNELCFKQTDLVVFGMPTYAGRLPNKIVPYVCANVHGGGALAAAVVTFGNRSYDNALAELCAVLEADGFHTVGAAAFACRHAFTDVLASGRPNAEDLLQAKHWAEGIAENVKHFTDIPMPVCVPGDPAAPYYSPRGLDGQSVKFLKAVPVTDAARCTGCGLCARICPMGAIDPTDTTSVPGMCIKCQACIRGCPEGAKHFTDPGFLSHVAMLERDFAVPGKNEVFS